MFRNLFGTLFRPSNTLNRLLEERRFGQSWGATWFLVIINALMVFLLGIFFAREFRELFDFLVEMDPMGEEYWEYATWGMMIGAGVVAVIGMPIYFVLSRFFFAWIVQLGVRISASAQFPRDPEDRREKAALLRLIQPYTLWIYLVAGLVSAIFIPFVVDLSGFMDLAMLIDMGEVSESEAVGEFVILGLYSMITNLVTLLMFIYMMVVRTMAIKKIYGITGSQAFWGPFLIYFLLYFALFLAYIVLILIITVLGGAPDGGPAML